MTLGLQATKGHLPTGGRRAITRSFARAASTNGICERLTSSYDDVAAELLLDVLSQKIILERFARAAHVTRRAREQEH